VKSPDRGEGFRWVGNKKSGIWIVRLIHDGILDHCVGGDNKRGMIFDKEEPAPEELSPQTLDMCGGHGTPGLRIAKVRELVEGRESSKKKSKISKLNFV